MGGEESVRSMVENDDGGHELFVAKDGKDGKAVPEEMAKRSIDAIDQQRDEDVKKKRRRKKKEKKKKKMKVKKKEER